MATRTKRMTVKTARLPTFTVHEIGDIPVFSAADKWHTFDWHGVKHEIRNGQAVSFRCEPDEYPYVRRFIEKFFNADEDAAHLKFDKRTKRVWIWHRNCSPYTVEHAEGE